MALAALLALVCGVPWALWSVGGAPWPAGAPRSTGSPGSSETAQIMSVLSVVLWLAWAHFCLCVAVEALAAVNGRRRSGYDPVGLNMVPEVVREMYAAIGTHGSPRGAEATTVALVDELLPAGRTPTVARMA